VTSRKKKIILIQITIFLVASSLLYNTYRNKNKQVEEEVKIELEINPDTNSFKNIEYSGFDLNGNRYTLQSSLADFDTKTPEAINMKGVEANFYLKNNTILKVISDEGFYNNITLDMKFTKNVKATHLTNVLFSDQLTYLNSNGKLLATGNVHGESVDNGEFSADNLEYDLVKKIFIFSMVGDKQVNVKLKKK